MSRTHDTDSVPSELNHTPYCRLCRIPLTAQTGCSVCTPIRRNVVWPNVSGGERYTVDDLAQDTARLMKRQLKALSAAFKDSTGFDPRLTRELNGLTRALTALLSEMRRTEERNESRVNAMNYKEQIEVICSEFFVGLPQEHQTELIGRLQVILDTSLLPMQ